MFVLGVDPGVTGALVLVDDESRDVIDFLDMPVIRQGKLAWTDGAILGDWLDSHPPTVAVIETVHTWAGNEGTEQSAKQRGMASRIAMLCRVAGGVETMLSAANIPFVHVTAGAWKARAGLLRKDKACALPLAKSQLRWPDGSLSLAKHLNRADAALIALYGYRPYAATRPSRSRTEQGEIDRLAAENVPMGLPFGVRQ